MGKPMNDKQNAEKAALHVVSLFAGIGGIDRGLERAGMTTVGQVEIDPFCQRVLAQHWPEVPRHDDVSTALDWWQSKPRPRVHVVAGGYPCPSFSQAARGRNVAPDLWPLMRDVIDGLRPNYVLLENVAAHLGRGFAGVLADLDALGFDAEWSTVTACSVGASHTRRRLLAVAYPHRDGQPVFPVDAQVAGVSTLAGDRRHWGIPTADDVRTDDGVPDRVDRIRVLGNAVVPAVAELAGRAIVADAYARSAVAA
jgi:DNA (cytosine-5)-methyltransferase 1